ncbi:MAG: hypothetical protein JWN84_1643 [Nocardioides sp.]|nr:hypothetical protein [Nocardioides sp.]
MNFRSLTRVLSAVLVGLFAVIGVLLVVMALFTRTDAAGVTRVAGRPTLTVLSDSMTPAFKAGDLIVETPVAGRADELAVGDVITFRAPNGLVTHRIIAVEKVRGSVAYRTQGDANNVVDATPVAPADVVGIYSFHIPNAGRALDAARTPRGLAVLILIPVLAFLAPSFARKWRDAGENNSDDNSDVNSDEVASSPLEDRTTPSAPHRTG